jgi:hypothetical protein
MQIQSDSPRLDTTANTLEAALPGIVKPLVLKETIMNAKQLIAATVLAVVGGVAIADEITVFHDAPSTLTRAEVKAELDRARAENTLPSLGEDAVVAVESPVSTAARADVRAEARAFARSNHEVNVGL